MSRAAKPYLGVAYYPEDWPEEQIDADIARMRRAGINCARIAEFAWHRMEPREGEFDFSFFHRVVDKLGAAGIAVIMGTPTATPPAWFARRYPEAFRLGADGLRREHGARRSYCSNNPYYNEYCLRISEKLAQEFGADPAVKGWQIDNEIYTGAGGECYCTDCVNGFRSYLRAKFGGIDALNEAWNLNLFSQWYDDFEQIPAPRVGWHNPHLKTEWSIFQNDSHIGFVERQAEILHKYTGAPVGTDIMPVNGMDYRRLNKTLDVVQFNHYNTPENLHHAAFWFDFLRTLKPERPFWNTETATCWNGSTAISQTIKPEGFCRANSWLPLALGAEANMYWLWRTHWAGHELMHGAVIDASGRDMHIMGEVEQTAQDFLKSAEFINGTRVKTGIAIHFSSLVWNMHAHQTVVNGWQYAPAVEERFYKPINDMGLRPDVIDAAQPLEDYKLIFSPMMMTLEEDELNKRMCEWVKNGGVWVVGPLSDIRDVNGARYRDRYYGVLEQLTGVRWRYGAPDTGEHIKAAWNDGTEFSGSGYFEMSDDGEAEVKVTSGHSALKGRGLLSVKRVGKGWVILLGAAPSTEDMKRIISRALDCAALKANRLEGSVVVSPRAGEAGEGMIAVEYGAARAEIELERPMTDLLTGVLHSGRVELQPYQVMVLKV